jgi:sulfur-oxidizing protein SoxY
MPDPRDLPRRGFLRAAAGTLGALVTASVGVPAVARGALGGARGGAPLPDDDEPTEAARKVLALRFGNRPLRREYVVLDAPEDAPDGRAVPLFIESTLPATYDGWVKGVHIVVDHNPDIYLAGYEFAAPPGGITLDTRIKMRRTSWVRAILETSRGELYYASKKIFVTMNGCV